MKHSFKASTLAATAVSALAALLTVGLTGCQMVNTSPARSVSVYSGSTVPTQYSLTTASNVVCLTVDRTSEGVVLSATLDEVEMPTVWAKVTNLGTAYYLYNKQVDPAGVDSASFVSLSGNYYAKYLQIGTGTDTKTFVGSTDSGALVYTYDSGSGTVITLPDSSLSATNRSWYYAQMTAGNYAVVADASGTAVTGVDYTLDATGAAAFSGATQANRWLKSANNSAWKVARDAAVTFITGKLLAGIALTDIASSGGYWTVGVDGTAIPDTWSFKEYYGIWIDLYTNGVTTTTTDTTTGATE